MSYDMKNYFINNTNVNPKNVPHKLLLALMFEYYKKYSEFFASPGLVDCPTFGQLYKDKTLASANMNENEYKKYLKDSKNIDHTFEVSTNPLHTIFFMAALNDPKVYKDHYEFLAFIMYSSKYRKYFKYGVKEPVMNKLYNEYLDNNSYIYKYKNIRKVLDVTIDTMLSDVGKKVFDGTDDDVLKILNSLSTRINLLVNKIAVKYYDLSDSNQVMFEETNIMGEDTMILTSTDHNKLVGIMSDFKDEEIKYGFNMKLYQAADPTRKYMESFKSAYKNALGEIFKLMNELINTFIKKRQAHDLPTMKKYFASDILSGSLKSSTITELHQKIAKLSGVSNSNAVEFRKILEKYLALRMHVLMNR